MGNTGAAPHASSGYRLARLLLTFAFVGLVAVCARKQLLLRSTPTQGPHSFSLPRPDSATVATLGYYDDEHPAPLTNRVMAARMPEPIRDVQPDYPREARTQGVEGTAMVAMWIRKDGTVAITQIVTSSGNSLLNTAAVRAGMQSTFTPARNNAGNPVNVWICYPYRFHMEDGKK